MTAPITATIKLEMPSQDFLFEHLIKNSQYKLPMCTGNMGKGKNLVICGAGPSIAQSHEEIWKTPAHQVWAANSALPYLIKNKLPVTHGITVDMSVEMWSDPNEWQTTYPVKYLVSSGVHPDLIPHLQKDKRDIRMFHSYLGIPNPEGWVPPINWQSPHEMRTGEQITSFRTYEMWIYQHLYGASVQVGYGLNTVPRAICLAIYMGFKSITVFGADCACAPDAAAMPVTGDPDYVPWLKSLKLYPDGRSDPIQGSPAKYGDNAVICQGMINGRMWHTRPDMLISAKHLYQMAYEMYAGRVFLRGDTLPNAMASLDAATRAAYFKTLPDLTGKGEVSGFGINTGS